MYIYILIDEYTPDGPTIYGVYSSSEKAEKVLNELSSDNNEYGRNMNKDNTIDIIKERVY